MTNLELIRQSICFVAISDISPINFLISDFKLKLLPKKPGIIGATNIEMEFVPKEFNSDMKTCFCSNTHYGMLVLTDFSQIVPFAFSTSIKLFIVLTLTYRFNFNIHRQQ